MTRQRAPVLTAALALHVLPARAVGFSQFYDEALSNDVQLQSARASLAANSEELPLARHTAALGLGVAHREPSVAPSA